MREMSLWNKDDSKAFGEIMKAYDLGHAAWLKKFGNDEHFNAWFTEQLDIRGIQIQHKPVRQQRHDIVAASIYDAWEVGNTIASNLNINNDDPFVVLSAARYND